MTSRRRFADAGAAALVVLLNLALYWKVLRLWWTYDDANNLRTILTFTFTDPFTNANVWPQQLFTPLMLVVSDAQYALFGFESSG